MRTNCCNSTRFFSREFNRASYGTRQLNFSQYRPLHRAILDGDWERVEKFYKSHRGAETARITESKDTALMVAIMSGQKIEFVKKLMQCGWLDLTTVNKEGNTALHEAAIVGHLKAAELLVGKVPSLLDSRNSDGYVPLHLAAANGQREILCYFLKQGVGLSELELDMLMHLEITARFFGPSPSRFVGASSTRPKINFRMAPAKKMRRLPPPKRALLEPYSPSTDTCIDYPDGLAADGCEPIGPSLSQMNVLSGSETIAPTPSQTNAPHGFEICEASLSETQAPSPQSQTSGAGASSSRRVRGPTVGKATAKRVANNNGNKLHIPITETFNAFEGVLATPGANEIGIQIRRMCPIQGVKSWTVADPATKGAVVQAVRDTFEIGDNYEDNALSQQVVEKKCSVLHKDWKCRMKKKWEKLVDAGTNPYAHPYKGIRLDDWKYLIDEVWLDPANKPRYDAGKKNRSKLPYNHTSGSRSFPAAMSIAVKENGGVLPDLCNFYKHTHQHKRTKQWIDPICGDLHEQMTTVRDESIEAGTPMRQEDISRVVLGKKKGYLRGFGVGPKPSSCDSRFSAASQARDEQLKRLTSELEILRAEQQSNREEQQKKEEEQQMKEAENTRQREDMQQQLFGLQSMLAQVLENRNPPNSRQ